MDLALAIIAIVLGIVGVVGAVVPVIPGILVSFAGMLCTFLSSQSEMSGGLIWFWGIASAVIAVLDYILPGLFSKLLGGSKAGVIGASIGVFVGMIATFLIGPLAIVIGPFVGAIVGEIIHDRKRDVDKIVAIGFSSLVSFIVGTGIKFIACGIMMYFIWVDAFHIIKEML